MPNDHLGPRAKLFVVAADDILFFSAMTPAMPGWVEGYRLWRSDGTPQGTAPVAFPVTPSESFYPQSISRVPGGVLLQMDDSIWWAPSAGGAGRKIADGLIVGSVPRGVSGVTYFMVSTCASCFDGKSSALLYRLDAAGFATVVAPIETELIFGAPVSQIAVTPQGVFGTPDLRSIWFSDGTAPPRTLVGLPGGARFFLYGAETTGRSSLLFTANVSDRDNQLWSSDGTAQGTGPVTFFRQAGFLSPVGYVNGTTVIGMSPEAGPPLYPDAPTSPMYAELLTLDPTAATGARPVRSLALQGTWWRPSARALVAPTRLLFSGARRNYVPATSWLWYTDGTTGGTGRVEFDTPDEIVSPSDYLGYVNGVVYYYGNSVQAGHELYRVKLADSDFPRYQTVDVTEYHHAALDHYFMTADPAEKARLDSGKTAGWKRTGYEFAAYAPGSGMPDTSPVCRFYGKPEAGLDSHFYSASPQECADVAARFAHAWQLESSNVFEAIVASPATGECLDNGTLVHRAFNQRRDANHRYSLYRTDQKAMQDKGWIPEGTTSAGIVMCTLAPSRP